MNKIRVIVRGASGRVGQVLVAGLPREPDIELVGAVDVQVAGDKLTLENGSMIPFSTDLSRIIDSTRPQAMVDFTLAHAVMPAVRTAAEKGVNLVIGTTGINQNDLAEIERLALTHKIGAVVAPNFALGAVLMLHFARIAAKYLDYAEIIELHHHLKADAPSGTALLTARAMAKARGKPFLRPAEQRQFPSRGENVEGVTVHSVRLPGLMAHQEVLFGGAGQTLSIRHDTIGRECYIPGVVLAIKEVVKRQGLVLGLDALLGLNVEQV